MNLGIGTQREIEHYPYEIQLLDKALRDRYNDIAICRCENRFYNVRVVHNHLVPANYVLVAHYAASRRDTLGDASFPKDGDPAIVIIYDYDTVSLFKATLDWRDPAFFPKLFSHLDKYAVQKSSK